MFLNAALASALHAAPRLTPAAPSRRKLPAAPLCSAARCPFCCLLPCQPPKQGRVEPAGGPGPPPFLVVLALWLITCLMLPGLHAGAAGRVSAQARTESIGAATAGVRLGQCAPDLRLQLYYGLGQVEGRMHFVLRSSLRIARARKHSREVP